MPEYGLSGATSFELPNGILLLRGVRETGTDASSDYLTAAIDAGLIYVVDPDAEPEDPETREVGVTAIVPYDEPDTAAIFDLTDVEAWEEGSPGVFKPSASSGDFTEKVTVARADDTEVLELSSSDTNGNTFKFYAGGIPSVSSVFPEISRNEFLLSSSTPGNGAFAVRNLAADGYAAYTARDNLGAEKFAIGYGNLGSLPFFAGKNYIQSWADGAAPELLISLDGTYGPIGSGFRFYKRFSLTADGLTTFWKPIPDGTTQRKSFMVDASGQGAHHLKLRQDDSSNSLQWWNQEAIDAALRVIAVGTEKPGAALGTDMVFSAYNGAAWNERVRIKTDTGAVGIGTDTPSTKALLDVASTTKGVRLPVMTTTQKNAITLPPEGLEVYDVTLHKKCVYTGSAWETIVSA